MKPELLNSILFSIFITWNINSECQLNNEFPLIKTTLRECFVFPREDSSKHLYDNHKYWLVDMKIINNSNSTIEFLADYNAPITNVILSSDGVKMVENTWINNSQRSIVLKQGGEFSFPLILETNNSRANKIRLGWAYLTYENTLNVLNYDNELKRSRTEYKNVIWSDSLSLDIRSANPVMIK